LSPPARNPRPTQEVFNKCRAHVEWLRLTFPADYRGSGHKVEVQQAVQVQIRQEQLADIRSRLPPARALLKDKDTSGWWRRMSDEAFIFERP